MWIGLLARRRRDQRPLKLEVPIRLRGELITRLGGALHGRTQQAAQRLAVERDGNPVVVRLAGGVERRHCLVGRLQQVACHLADETPWGLRRLRGGRRRRWAVAGSEKRLLEVLHRQDRTGRRGSALLHVYTCRRRGGERDFAVTTYT
eukprot:5145360-Prymnesium_polylepis.2